MGVVNNRFSEYGFPLYEDRKIIPVDDTTLFVCSGMQQLKSSFKKCNGDTYGSLQSCVRTNDLELVGDGSHLTHFVMLGNFSFGGPDYDHSVRMWHNILVDLGLFSSCTVHVHPEQEKHKNVWRNLGWPIVEDSECVWSDGDIAAIVVKYIITV